MRYLIAGGTGFIGQYLSKAWLTEGIEVTVVGRDKQKIMTCFEESNGSPVHAMTWQELEAQGSRALTGIHMVLNLAGANIGQARWSDARRQVIVESRSKTTKLIGSLCAQLADKAPLFFNASAIGIYGLQAPILQGLPPSLDEEIEIDFSTAPDFLAQVARIWEAKTHLAKAHGVAVVNLRFAVVLGPNGGVLQQLAMPFKWGLGGPMGTGQQVFSWVHIADVKAAIDFLLSHPTLVGPVNLVAPNAVTQREFALTLAKQLHRPCLFATPAWLLNMLYGEMANELLLQGQHVRPLRLLAQGFEFKYPTLAQALAHC